MNNDALTILKPGDGVDHVTAARDRLDGRVTLTFDDSSYRLTRDAADAIACFILRIPRPKR